MEKIIKLKERRDYNRLYKIGKTFVDPCFVLYKAKGRTAGIRLGITTGKKLGIAVMRNRARRVITAAFRECLPHIKSGTDIVIVARTRILKLKSTEVAVLLEKQLKNADLWKENA